MAIRAITFDFWRTLFRDADGIRRQKVRSDAFAEASGKPPEIVDPALKAIWREFDRCHKEEQRTLGPQDAVRMLCQDLDVSLSPAATQEMESIFATAILQYPAVPIEDALDAVSAAAQHYPVALISDTTVSPGSSLRKLLERNGFLDHMEVLTFSDEVGASKPQASMYESTARALDLPVADLLHIGDLEYTDVIGAKAVGASAALFTGEHGEFAGRTTADYEFNSWRAFIEALPNLD